MQNSVGAFLKSKMGNMARWVTQEVGKENVPVDVEAFVEERSWAQVTYLAEVLSDSAGVIIAHRDWSGLVRLIKDEDFPAPFVELVQIVRARPDLHDKFWRYLELFREVVLKSDDVKRSR